MLSACPLNPSHLRSLKKNQPENVQKEDQNLDGWTVWKMTLKLSNPSIGEVQQWIHPSGRNLWKKPGSTKGCRVNDDDIIYIVLYYIIYIYYILYYI